MPVLKVKTTIECAKCYEPLVRTKSIQVDAATEAAAKVEAAAKIKKWTAGLAGQLCKVCRHYRDHYGER